MVNKKYIGMTKKMLSDVVFTIGGFMFGVLLLFLGIIYIAIYVIWELMDHLLGRLA